MAELNRLLLVIISLGRGGAESHLVRIANVLSRQYDVQIAVIFQRGSYQSLVSGNIPIHHIGSAWTRVSTLAACHFASGKLAALIDVVQPDAVLAFLEPVIYTCYRARHRCRHRFTNVAVIQNNLDRNMESLDGIMKWPIRRGVIRAIASADGIVAISNGVAENVIKWFPGVAGRIRTIYNAAYEELPVPAIRSDFTPPFKIVACGRLSEQKGFCDLLDAFRLVRNRLDAKLKILGTGPLLAELKDQACKLGIDGDVEFAGFQDDPLVHFREADLFVLSSWWEGFGNVIVEAMGVGTPVVSTDCPFGPNEIITHGVDGMLVPVRAPEKLAEQILNVLTDHELRAKLAARGRVRSEDFLARTIAGRYADFVNELIQDS
jgi:glycosyltransferase involved in cell wall biosynthesis